MLLFMTGVGPMMHRKVIWPIAGRPSGLHVKMNEKLEENPECGPKMSPCASQQKLDARLSSTFDGPERNTYSEMIVSTAQEKCNKYERSFLWRGPEGKSAHERRLLLATAG